MKREEAAGAAASWETHQPEAPPIIFEEGAEVGPPVEKRRLFESQATLKFKEQIRTVEAQALGAPAKEADEWIVQRLLENEQIDELVRDNTVNEEEFANVDYLFGPQVKEKMRTSASPLELFKGFSEQFLERCISVKSEIIEKPLPVDDPKVRQPDISKAKRVLSWEPEVALEDGLRITLDYFKERMSKEG